MNLTSLIFSLHHKLYLNFSSSIFRLICSTHIAVILSFSSVHCQSFDDYFIRHFDTRDGLSNNWISDITQDEEGFLWIGTQYGLNRFDGREFESFTYRSTDTTSISTNWVKSIFSVSNDKLLIGTQGGGLNILNPQTEVFKKPKTTLTTTSFSDIAINNNDQVIYSTSSGVFVSSVDFDSIQQVFDGIVRTIVPWQKGKYLVGTANGIRVVINDIAQPEVLLEGKYIMDFIALGQDSILAYADDSLFLLIEEDDGWTREIMIAKLERPDQSRFWPFMNKEKSGRIWVSNGHLIWRFSKNLENREKTNIGDVLRLPQSDELSVHCMFQDKEGSIWIGTNLGLFQLVKTKKLRHPYLEEMNLSFAKTRGMAECGDYMWLANAKGLYAWNKLKNSPPILVSDHQTRALYGRSDGYLYFIGNTPSGQRSIFRINSHTFKIEDLSSKIDIDQSFINGSFKIVEDKKGRLWFSNWNNLLCYHPATHEAFLVKIKADQNLIKPGIIDMSIDTADNMWIGSMLEGLIKIPNISNIVEGNIPEVKQYKHNRQNPRSISTNLIQAVHRAKDGKVWVGTDGGINVLDLSTETFKKYLRNDDIPDDKILTVTSDAKGKIWMGSISHGILSYDPETDKFKSYTTEDGLYDDAMLLNSVYKDSSGQIWMGSTSGLHCFNPLTLNAKDVIQPKLSLLSVTKIQEDTIQILKFPSIGNDISNPVIINAKDKSVSWDFATLTFKNPVKTQYKFKISGLHSDWLPPQDNGTFTFTNLPRGNRELKVESFSEDASWQPVQESFFLKVIPPWYQSTIAYLSYLLLIGLFIRTIYKIQINERMAVQEKEHLKSLTQTKSHWFHQIAHEFRTPLTVILGAANQWKDKLEKIEQTSYQTHFDQIKDQTTHLSNQVNQILEIAQLSEGFPKVMNHPGDFIKFQKSMLHSFQSYAHEKNIELNFQTELSQLHISFDEDKWRKITSNILSNAIKYTPSKGVVKMEILQLKKGWIDVVITDNGYGISKKFLEKIYQPFTREQSTSDKGIGLGLNLTKELVILLGGNINIESQEYKGTKVSLQVPIEDAPQKGISEPHPLDYALEEKATILVAEDNVDVAEYIKYCLSNYHVIEARNGMKAWEACQEQVPDLVVSDVMMPLMSGLDLAAKIREHPVTDHIPIVLLTAKIGNETQLKGLRAGAEVYLTKPFDREELLVRINQLLKVRSQLKAKYQSGEFVGVSDNSKVDSFLKSIVNIINDNIDDENFSVEQLAKATFMSRVHLFRKLKTIAGMSPTQLIRKIKMTKAKQLLRSKQLSISEVAYATGFKDAAYFSRVFSEEFGHPPSEEASL